MGGNPPRTSTFQQGEMGGGSNNYMLQQTSVIMIVVTRRRPFRLDTIHPSVLGDTQAWFGRKWVGTRRERVLFYRAKWGGL
jgi:hypothetical protein